MKATLATLSIRRRLITMASALAVAVGTAAGASAQEASGPREGIKVHGHWIIEVKNPDGTRAQYREFENALVAQGASALSRLLSTQVVPSTWFIWLGTNTGAPPCIRVGFPTSCAITNAIGAQGTVPTEFFQTISITAPTSGPNAGKFVLSGNATSSNTAPSSIGYVLTQLWACPNTQLPATTCLASGLVSQFDFTSTAVTPAIPIQPGQVIQVTVIISFS